MTTSPDALVLLSDAHYAAEKILRFTKGRTREAYLGDDMLRAAVERQFEIIGEAFTILRRTHPTVAGQVPDIDHAIAFRNRLIHGYATVSDSIVWAAVEAEIPTLAAALVKILERLDP